MQDHGVSYNTHRPCVQKNHRQHTPEWFENLLRDRIRDLARTVELDTKDIRPTAEFWESCDREALLNECMRRHKA
jgi:hypothetical protein